MKKNVKMLTKSELYELGWNRDIIDILMPEPDGIQEKTRWTYRQNLYSERRVKKLMSTVKYKKIKMLSKSQVKERGMSESMILKLLGAPDRYEANPIRKRGMPMCLYSLYRVERAEASHEYNSLMAKKTKRSETAQAIVDFKKERNLNGVRSMLIGMRQLEESELKRCAVLHYNNLWRERGVDKYATVNDDELFLQRIMVNYLRHGCSKYERMLDRTYGEIGASDARKLIREKVFQKITELYPYLNEECKRQLEPDPWEDYK